MRATSIVAVSLLAMGGTAWGADTAAAALREQVHRPDPDEATVALTLPGGARIGVIDLLNTDITHFHTGRGGGNNTFMRTYSVRWPLAEEVDQPLANAIQSAGFTAVPTRPCALRSGTPMRGASRSPMRVPSVSPRVCRR